MRGKMEGSGSTPTNDFPAVPTPLEGTGGAGAAHLCRDGEGRVAVQGLLVELHPTVSQQHPHLGENTGKNTGRGQKEKWRHRPPGSGINGPSLAGRKPLCYGGSSAASSTARAGWHQVSIQSTIERRGMNKKRGVRRGGGSVGADQIDAPPPGTDVEGRVAGHGRPVHVNRLDRKQHLPADGGEGGGRGEGGRGSLCQRGPA